MKKFELTSENNEYGYYVKTISEECRSLLNTATTTGMIFLNKKNLDYPKFWNGDKFNLPYNYFETCEYNNTYFETITNPISYYGEGDLVRVVNEDRGGYNIHIKFDKVSSIFCV